MLPLRGKEKRGGFRLPSGGISTICRYRAVGLTRTTAQLPKSGHYAVAVTESMLRPTKQQTNHRQPLHCRLNCKGARTASHGRMFLGRSSCVAVKEAVLGTLAFVAEPTT